MKMTSFIKFCVLLFSLLLYSCTPIYYPTDSLSNKTIGDKMPNKPGSCYAKCFIPNKYETETLSYAKYTGDKNDDPNVEKIVVQEGVKTTRWVKKKADKNCLSSNPDDCLVWCLVEDVEDEIVRFAVKDTTLTTDFIWIEEEKKNLVSKGGFTEWREVVCANELSSKFYENITSALIENGFQLNPLNNSASQEFKAALIKYQENNYLPVGQIDFETLQSLNIEGY